MIGKIIGSYRITGFLGSGGSGQVYAAEHDALNRSVALKFLLPELLPSSDAVKRFVREAQLAAKLNHPNIVDIFDVSRSEQGYFIAMELVRGRSLRQVIAADGRLQVERALGIAHEVAGAMAYAHRYHIIHRDIKPDNIMVCDDGHVKVLDFGLAKVLGSDTKLTKTGAAMGTPHYMSPEQCRSEDVDARTDIYSLGVVLFEMLTGKTPFVGNSALEVLMQITKSPFPPLRSISRDVSPALEVLVMNMTEKDSSGRYVSCGDLIDDIEKMSSNKKFMPQRRSEMKDLTEQGMGLVDDLVMDRNGSAFAEPRVTESGDTNWVMRVGVFVVVLILIGAGIFVYLQRDKIATTGNEVAVLDSDDSAVTINSDQGKEVAEDPSGNEYGLNMENSPFVVGSRWTYKVQGGGNYVVHITKKITFKGEPALEVMCYPPENIFWSFKSIYVANQYGIRVYEPWDENNSWLYLEFPMTVGKRWGEKNEAFGFLRAYKAEAEKNIKVPAGDFSCIQVNSGLYRPHPDSLYYENRWWNPDIGIVKLRRTFTNSDAWITAELVSFERGR